MEEQYELDSYVEESIYMLFGNRAEYIVSSILTVNKMLDIPNLYLLFDTMALESEITDTIYNNEDSTVDELRDTLEVIITRYFDEYLKEIGVTFNELTFKQYKDVFESLYTMFTIDVKTSDEFLTLLETEYSDDAEHLAALLAEFSTMTEIDLLEHIEDVHSDLLDDLRYYYAQRQLMSNNDVDEEVSIIIEQLISLDGIFANSKIVIEAMNTDFVIMPFNHFKDNLYNRLLTMKDNIHLMPYEIVATLMLSEDSKENMVEFYNEYIDLSFIPFLENNTTSYNLVDEEVKKLIANLILKG